MRALWLLPLALACGLGGCPGNDPDLGPASGGSGGGVKDATSEPLAPVSVRVVNWNVRNFFNDVLDSPELMAECPPGGPTSGDPCETVVSSAEYKGKLNGVTAVLKPLAADILILPEVENDNVSAALAASLDAGYAHHHTTQGNDPRGIDIAVLSKYAIARVVSHRDEFFTGSADPNRNYRFARDVLEVHFTINGRPVVLLGVHLKAQTDVESVAKRTAEAERVRAIADGISFTAPSAMLVVLGDFNDTPGSAAINALRSGGLGAVSDGIPDAERYSTIFSGNKLLIDDQLIDSEGQALLDNRFPDALFIDHSAGASNVSDHAPVVATYLIQ